MIDRGFEHWWALVWRKDGKMRARFEFNLALEHDLVDYETLCNATRRQTADYLRKRTERAFMMLPQNWLRDRRWLDELPEVPNHTDGERRRRADRVLLSLRLPNLPKPDLHDVRACLALGDITPEQASKLGVRIGQ